MLCGASRDGVAADVKTYNTLIDTWAKTGKAVEAEKFYVLMKRYHSSPHTHTHIHTRTHTHTRTRTHTRATQHTTPDTHS